MGGRPNELGGGVDHGAWDSFPGPGHDSYGRRLMVRSFRSPALVALACSLVFVTACGSDEPDTATPAPPVVAPGTTPSPDTSSTSTTTSPPTDEQAVLAAVDCYWATLLVANDPPNPDHPGYQACFTGDARARAIAGSEKYLRDGQRVGNVDGYARSNTTIIAVSDNAAVVAECFVDDGIVEVAATGAVVNSETASVEVEIDLGADEGTWRVAKVRGIRERLGANVCPDA